MIERNHPSLSVGAQCRLLSISRSSFYYAPQGETPMNLDLMLLIYKQFLDTPFYGVQQMTWHWQNEGYAVNQKRIWRLMRLMRLMPIYQKPDTSKPAKGHKTYRYLLGGLRVERPNQVCARMSHHPYQAQPPQSKPLFLLARQTFSCRTAFQLVHHISSNCRQKTRRSAMRTQKTFNDDPTTSAVWTLLPFAARAQFALPERIPPTKRAASGHIDFRYSPATKCSTSNPNKRMPRMERLLNGGRLASPQPSSSMTHASPKPLSL